MQFSDLALAPHELAHFFRCLTHCAASPKICIHEFKHMSISSFPPDYIASCLLVISVGDSMGHEPSAINDVNC